MPFYGSNATNSNRSGEQAQRSPDSIRDASTDDQTLLGQIASGHEDALRQLYAAYRPRLWRFIAQQVHGDNELTNTVLQDVFLSVWRTASAYRGEATVATWLFCMARNIASSARRGKFGDENHRQLFAELIRKEEQEQHATRELGSPEQAVVDRLTLREAFAGLSSKHREVLELIFLRGFTYEETARILDIPLGTVKSRLNTARQLLSKVLAELDRELS